MKKAIDMVARLMDISAENAPKCGGESQIEITILDEAEKEMLVEEMYQLSDQLKKEGYSRRGERLEEADKVILMGLSDHPTADIDCSACGFLDCDDFSDADEEEGMFKGPNCIFRVLDLGMALGSAVEYAELHSANAEIMVRAGHAARSLGLCTARICIAIPIYLEGHKDYLVD